jgi:hypothetical protein
VIPLLFFFFLSFVLIPTVGPFVAGIPAAATTLLLDLLFRLVLAGLLAASVLLVRAVVYGHHPDSR